MWTSALGPWEVAIHGSKCTLLWQLERSHFFSIPGGVKRIVEVSRLRELWKSRWDTNPQERVDQGNHITWTMLMDRKICNAHLPIASCCFFSVRQIAKRRFWSSVRLPLSHFFGVSYCSLHNGGIVKRLPSHPLLVEWSTRDADFEGRTRSLKPRFQVNVRYVSSERMSIVLGFQKKALLSRGKQHELVIYTIIDTHTVDSMKTVSSWFWRSEKFKKN